MKMTLPVSLRWPGRRQLPHLMELAAWRHSRAACPADPPDGLAVEPGDRTIALTMEERLRIIGRWLDARDARSFELLLGPEAILVACEDGQGQPQERIFSEPRLQRMALLARTSNRHGAEVREGVWGPALRSLGQILEGQAAVPRGIWSEGETIRVAEGSGAVGKPLRYSRGGLLAHDAAAQAQRVRATA